MIELVLACFFVICVVIVIFQIQSVVRSLNRSSRATAITAKKFANACSAMAVRIESLSKSTYLKSEASNNLTIAIAALNTSVATLTKAVDMCDRNMVKKDQLKEAVNLLKRTNSEKNADEDTTLEEDINTFRQRVIKELRDGGKSIDEAEVIAAGMVYGSMGNSFGMDDVANEAR